MKKKYKNYDHLNLIEGIRGSVEKIIFTFKVPKINFKFYGMSTKFSWIDSIPEFRDFRIFIAFLKLTINEL